MSEAAKIETPTETAPGESWDAIVVGAGFGGLVASAYLARAGLRVLVLDARDTAGGACETVALEGEVHAPLLAPYLNAVDAKVISELKLHRHGLKFAERAMAVACLRPGGRHIVLPHDGYGARSAIRPFSAADAQAYPHYLREMRSLSRKLRPLWFGESGASRDDLGPAIERRLEILARMSAAAYLDTWFENDALKALLGAEHGLSAAAPHEPGTALHLLWRFAQEACGNQGAAAHAAGGPGALSAAALASAGDSGAVFRFSSPVKHILASEQGRVAGVVLANGEKLSSRVVVSSLGRNETLALAPPETLGIDRSTPAPAPRVASAAMVLALAGPPPFAGLAPRALRARLVIAERPESAAEAKGAGQTGRLPAELVFDMTVPSAADGSLAPQGQHVLSALIPYLPASPPQGWDAWRGTLQKQALAAIESYAPGLSDRLTAAVLVTPDELVARYGSAPHSETEARILSTYRERIATGVHGLYLCGAAAEPLNVISGRAGRLAAVAAVALLREKTS